jgi:hypothetical protein
MKQLFEKEIYFNEILFKKLKLNKKN